MLAIPVALASFLFAGAASAAALAPPSGLAPGAQYRVAFVTSTGHDGWSRLSSGNFAYDAFVNTVANAAGSVLAPLAATWQVLGSEDRAVVPGLYANERVVGATPIYLLDGALVASNAADLWDGSIAHAINLSELGTTVNGRVWTGSESNGTEGSVGSCATCASASFGYDTHTKFGNSSDTGASWIAAGTTAAYIRGFGGVQYSLYGISGVMTAPVPEPETYALLTAGLGLVGFFGRRRKVQGA